MTHFFVEPDLLGLALSIAQWSDPWHRSASFQCDDCGRGSILIMVSTRTTDEDACEELLREELLRRGWKITDDPELHKACPRCVG